MGSGSGCVPNSKGKKITATRRSWNPMEEQLLMEQLKELVAGGSWKTENGFRPGYLQKLEEKMRAKLSGTDIRGSPHINSRITIWKRHHGCLQIALGGTGGGFNSTTEIIDVSDIAWEKAVKRDPTVAGMHYKPWPFYHDWIEVFGLDKANGKACEDVIDAVNELVSEDTQAHVGETVPGANYVHVDDGAPCEMDVESQSVTIETGKTNTSSSKKRPYSYIVDNNKELFDGLAALFRESDDKIVDTLKTIATEPKIVDPNIDLFNMLEKIPDLSLDEMFDVSENLSKNPKRLAMFIGFPEHARPRYVRRFLDGDFDKN